MSCLCLSRTSPSLREENPVCLQKPLTKAALFVISLLFAGGAVASHFAGIGIPGIVSFSLISGGCMAVFLGACLCSSSKKPPSELDRTKNTKDSLSEEEQALKRSKEIRAHVEGLSANELLQRMLIWSNDARAIEDSGSQDLPSEEENRLIRHALGEKIRAVFSAHSQAGDAVMAQKIHSIFSEALSSPDHFDVLATLIVEASCSNYNPRFIACVLERFEWPDEEKKNKCIVGLLASLITLKYISWQEGFIELGSPENPKGFNTNRLVVMTKNIFGEGDFTTHPKSIPVSLMEAIAAAIQLSGCAAIEVLESQKKNEEIEEDTNLGIQVVIGQYVECRFPASMLAPMLPHLTHVPGLVGLQLSDVGMWNPLDRPLKTTQGQGFGDNDVDALLEIFRTNRHLMNVRILIDGMAPEKLEEFMKQWQQIWEGRTFEVPQVEELLTIKDE